MQHGLPIRSPSAPPLVSVTIPAYNCAPFIAETLESILAQTYASIELIVVDDGSTDGTAEVIKPYMDRIVYHRQRNAGLGAARNAGMKLARGEFVAWCDADDLSEPDRLATQAAYLTHNQEVMAIGSDFAAFEGEGRIIDSAHAANYYSELAERGLDGTFPNVEDFDGRSVAWLPQPLPQVNKVHWGPVWRHLLLGNFIHPPTLMMRANACSRAGWLKEDLRTNEDWEYITRLARLGPLAFVEAPLLRYRCHPHQMSSAGSSPLGAINCIRVLEAHRQQCDALDIDMLGRIDVRLARAHTETAYYLSHSNRRQALWHLLRARSIAPREARLLFHVVRMLVPLRGIEFLRSLRHASGRRSHVRGQDRTGKPTGKSQP